MTFLRCSSQYIVDSHVIYLDIPTTWSPASNKMTLLFVWSYLPTRPLGQDMTQGQFLSGV